ncbi:MAG TPA: phage tail sheath family protein, partial [Casimicrobiaceae bacterium]
MPVNLTFPGVYIEEVPSGVRTISGVSTSIALFIGWAARGAVDRAVRLTSFADYEREYGGLDLRTLLGYSVKQFFDNRGSDAYVLRIAAGDAVAAATAIGDLDISASSPGDWATDYQIRLTRRPDDATRFRLDVLFTPSSSAVVESFENLSMADGDARFVETMVNDRSAFITVDATSTTTPANATVDLDATPGDDGTVLGPADAAFRTALLARFGL